ncbi:hypothetical protein DOY81_001336 [Sarcophaga bullata]|nr:hypothetical protein DOY81_001336 [Sarcophaga bullata]
MIISEFSNQREDAYKYFLQTNVYFNLMFGVLRVLPTRTFFMCQSKVTSFTVKNVLELRKKLSYWLCIGL